MSVFDEEWWTEGMIIGCPKGETTLIDLTPYIGRPVVISTEGSTVCFGPLEADPETYLKSTTTGSEAGAGLYLNQSDFARKPRYVPGDKPGLFIEPGGSDGTEYVGIYPAGPRPPHR